MEKTGVKVLRGDKWQIKKIGIEGRKGVHAKE